MERSPNRNSSKKATIGIVNFDFAIGFISLSLSLGFQGKANAKVLFI